MISDRNRRDVFVVLMAGETDFERLVKRARLVKPAAARALRELEERGLVKREDDARVTLTPAGVELSRELKRQDVLR